MSIVERNRPSSKRPALPGVEDGLGDREALLVQARVQLGPVEGVDAVGEGHGGRGRHGTRTAMPPDL
jgi:hypothetical protein